MPGDIETTYQKRFAGLEERRVAIWRVLASDFFQRWVDPSDTVLDIGAGYCEFINAIKARAKYALDLNPSTVKTAGADVHVLQQDVSKEWALESNSINLAFSSNFFEHLQNKEILAQCLKEAFRVLKPNGRFIVMGPNIRFAYDVYWDFIDHHLPLSDRSMEEALNLSGFCVQKLIPRFLPYAMSEGFPPSPILLRLYLLVPFAWNMFGKQFLVIACKPSQTS